MISSQAVQSALPLAARLAEKGLCLIAKEGSYLDALVSATLVDMPGRDLAGVDIDGTVRYTNFVDERLGVSKHDQVFDVIVQNGSQVVSRQLAFARNTVNPLIEQLANLVKDQLAAISADDISGMQVREMSVPSLLDSASFREDLMKFEDTPVEDVSLVMALPDQTAEQILELMKTGSANADASIEEWVAEKGGAFLEEVWSYVFQQNKSIPKWIDQRKPHSVRSVVYDPIYGLDAAFVIYLITNRITEKPIEGTEMPLDEYEALVLKYRNQAGKRLIFMTQELDDAEKNGTLIKGFEDRTTIVYPHVYRKWMEEGGDVDVLYGNALSARRAYSVSAINAEAESLREEWKRYSALIMKAQENNRYTHIKKAFAQAFDRLDLGDSVEGEQRLAQARLIYGQELDAMYAEEIEDIYCTSMKLVCRSFFTTSSAERILRAIDAISRKNPTLSVRECALMATADLIND